MEKPLLIREARAEEAELLAEIEEVCFPAAEAASPEQIRHRMAVFPKWFLVAETEGKVIGMINGMTTDQPTITDDLYEQAELHREQGAVQTVFGLDVLPEWRKTGVAGTLMRSFVEQARICGRKKVILTCKQHLIAMYEHLGFTCRGVSGSIHGGVVWYDMEMELLA